MLLIRRFLKNAEGATAIEYCMIAGLIAIAVVSGVTTIGTKLNRFFTGVSSGLN